VEEKIDSLIEEKAGLAGDLLQEGGGEPLLTEISDKGLLRIVALEGSTYCVSTRSR
jgi:hypothetical protein